MIAALDANPLSIQFWLSSPNMVFNILGIIFFIIIVFIIFSVFGYMVGWLERKLMARAQFRHGPTYVGKWGILQNLADLVKLLAKQDLTLDNADKFLYVVSLPLLLALSVFIVLILPYSPDLQATNLSFGLIIAFTIISFFPILLFTSGFSTGNKFADISAQRSVLMLISYEVPTLIVVASIAMLTGSYSFQAIIAAQSSSTYYAILMPIGFVVFFITMLAEFERPPFDLREADNELIAGWLTDYSSPYYALSLFLDYTRMFLGSVLIAILFFGGWLGPILPPLFWLLLKAFIISIFVIMVRATAFRMRIDRVLRLGWTWLVPLSLINLLWVFYLVTFVG